MDVQQQNLNDFIGGFKSTEDLLAQALGKPPVATETPEPVPPVFKSTEELIAEAQGKKVETPEPPKEEEVTEPKEGEVIPPVEEPKKGGRPISKLPENFGDIVKVLEDKGKLVGFEDGKYESIEDLEALLDANFDNRLEALREEARNEVTQGFTPAMKAIFEYAKMGVQQPQQLIPFLTAVDNYQYTIQLDPKLPEHQVEIVRNALSIQGLSPDVVEAELAELSEVEGKLEKRALALKPTLDNFNQKQIEKIYAEQQRAQQDEAAFWNNHQKAVKSKIIDNKTVSGLNLKKEHRQLAYASLAQPDPQLGTLGIYALVDQLIDKGDFETLTEMLLVGFDKKAYYNYIGSSALEKQAEQTQRILRQGVKSTPVEAEKDDVERPKLKRDYLTKTKFSLND